MSRRPALIISDSVRMPAGSQAGDVHDAGGHYRYCGSSACNGGERLSQIRSGHRPSLLSIFGFQNLG